jgi:glutamate dehydrogenase (NAD(P)+)
LATTRGEFDRELGELESEFDAKKPVLELAVRDPDDGCEGYVVVWNVPAGGDPALRFGKGGTRILPGLVFEDIRDLARRMSLKNAAAGLPIGGAKSGLRADPSAPDFQRQYRRFVRQVKPFLAEFGGPFGGFGLDVGADPAHAEWVLAELGTTRSFTGKSVELGGSDYDNEGIAGLGVAVAADTLLREMGEDPAAATFAVQGLGAMGAAVVRYFAERGGRLAAVSDPRVGGSWKLREPGRAELVAMIGRRDVDGARALLPEVAERIDPDSDRVLFEQVDVLFPCALQGVITAKNVDSVRARVLVEGANGPCEPAAHEKLHERGVPIVPDIIANPGGIIAAFVEMTADDDARARNPRTREIVERAKRETETRIPGNVREMYEVSRRFSVSGARAGRYLAYRRVLDRAGAPAG